jgi:hypothetical protein
VPDVEILPWLEIHAIAVGDNEVGIGVEVLE